MFDNREETEFYKPVSIHEINCRTRAIKIHLPKIDHLPGLIRLGDYHWAAQDHEWGRVILVSWLWNFLQEAPMRIKEGNIIH